MAKQGKLTFLFLILFIFPLAAQTSSVTSDGYLRDWQSDGDHVLYSTDNGLINSVTTADEERLVLRKYDTRRRLISETVWSADYSTITSETVWTYPETGVHPESMTKTLPEQKQKVCVLYSSAGLEKERTTWKTGADTADVLLEKTTWQYDDKKRLVCKIHEVQPEGKQTEKSSALIEKTEYTYTEKADEPDMLYFENDVLVEKIERSSDSMYTDSLYFDGMEIQTTWEDGVKIDEVYYLDGKEIKRKQL